MPALPAPHIAGPVFAAMFALTTSPANTEPLVYACKFVEGTPGGQYSSKVNRLVIDQQSGTVNLSAAETIGTSNPIEYSFKSEGGDQVMIKKSTEGTAIAALRFGTPNALFLSANGDMIWQYPDAGRAEFARFLCQQ